MPILFGGPRLTCHVIFLLADQVLQVRLVQGSYVFNREALRTFAQSLTVLVLCHVFSMGLSPSHKYHPI